MKIPSTYLLALKGFKIHLVEKFMVILVENKNVSGKIVKRRTFAIREVGIVLYIIFKLFFNHLDSRVVFTVNLCSFK